MSIFYNVHPSGEGYPGYERGLYFATKDEAFTEAKDASIGGEARVYRVVIHLDNLKETVCLCLNGEGYAASQDLIAVFVNGRQNSKLLKDA